MKVKDIIKELQKYKDQNYELVYDMFDESDIRGQAREMEITLTDKQVAEVIEYLEPNADATEGMSWATIGYAINEIINEE